MVILVYLFIFSQVTTYSAALCIYLPLEFWSLYFWSKSSNQHTHILLLLLLLYWSIKWKTCLHTEENTIIKIIISMLHGCNACTKKKKIMPLRTDRSMWHETPSHLKTRTEDLVFKIVAPLKLRQVSTVKSTPWVTESIHRFPIKLSTCRKPGNKRSTSFIWRNSCLPLITWWKTREPLL